MKSYSWFCLDFSRINMLMVSAAPCVLQYIKTVFNSVKTVFNTKNV